MPRKREPPGGAAPERTARATRSTAATKAGTKRPRAGTQRMTAAAIVTRNAQIAEMREVEQMMWEDIAAHFKIDVKTARRGYDDQIEGRQHPVNFEQAMQDMREYVAVIQRNRQVLAKIAHELEMAEPEPAAEGEQQVAPKRIKQDVRARIAAMHEHVEHIFKEIAIKQAIGDLPLEFGDLLDSRDWEHAYERAMEVLRKHDIPHHVFVEIAASQRARIDAPAPKTPLPTVV